MNAIVSVTSDWGIGYRGGLVVRNRADMRRFVRLTMDGTVVMGRATFESLPAGPLTGRRNIVVTHDPTYASSHPGVECASSPEGALALVQGEYPETVWLIGGESLYRALLTHCTRCEVTRNQVSVPVDAFFPRLDNDPCWELSSVGGEGLTDEGIAYDFATYLRV